MAGESTVSTLVNQEHRIDRAKRSLRGTLLGDSLGLVYEGLSPAKIAKRLGEGEIGPAFIAGRAVPSDDTAHAYMTAWALHECQGDADLFQNLLARQTRNWFLALPFGIGLATLKSGIKLSFGVRPPGSGIDSAGNGPAMRAPVIGWWFADEPDKLALFVRKSTEITHRHPLALQGSQLAAEAAACVARGEDILLPGPDWKMDLGNSTKGPSGFIVHTMSTVFDILASEEDARRAIDIAIRRGGDTDTIAAILGGIMGLGTAPQVRLAGWPNWASIESFPARPPYWRMLAFHLSSYPVVLAHGFRRLF